MDTCFKKVYVDSIIAELSRYGTEEYQLFNLDSYWDFAHYSLNEADLYKKFTEQCNQAEIEHVEAYDFDSAVYFARNDVGIFSEVVDYVKNCCIENIEKQIR